MPKIFRLGAVALMAMAFAALLMPSVGAASPTLPISPTNWVPVAFAAVLLVIAVSAFVYAFSGLTNSWYAKAWAQNQVYQGVFSLVLLIIFIYFVYTFFINPVTAFNNAGLVPGYGAGQYNCQNTNTIFTLSACDMYTFNQNAFNVMITVGALSYIAGLSPGISVQLNTLPNDPGVDVKASLIDVVPIEEEQLIVSAFLGLFFALVLNQVQSLLVGGALLWLSLFLTIGLVARCFGVTRTFGGSMIAFGLGLGFVYPVLISLTYGFINVGSGPVSVANNVAQIVPLLVTAFFAVLSGQFGFGGTLILLNSDFIRQLAYVIAGLTFIPFLNFTILDAFIRDFSRAIGNQVDFMSLLGGLL